MSEDTPELDANEEKEFLLTAFSRFKLSAEAENQNRKDALEADKFSTGDQWPETIRTGRENGPNPRPCLTIDKTDPAVRQVVNDARQNRPSAKIIPQDDGDVKTAKTLEGLIRYIQTNSNSDVAIDNAYDQMVRGGWAYFRVLTEFCDNKSFNQDIKIKQIRNRFTVYPDPFAVEPDYSDMRFCFIVDDIPTEEFKKKYPKAKINDIDFQSVGDATMGWKTSEATRIAEYWVREEVKSGTLYEWLDGTVSDQAPPPPQEAKRQRDIYDTKVTCYKITAAEVIEQYEWAGKYIPIIVVLGEDHDIDGKRKIRGMVKQMMDPQRMYNYMSSASIEAIALAPKAPWLIAAGQIEGYENIWAQANVANFSHLPYNATDTNGVLHPQPSRISAEPPIQAITYAIRQASEDMQSTSGQFDPSLGKNVGNQSGRAIQNLQRQGSVSTFHFVDNLSRALRFLGVILLDLIPKIYDAARVVSITHENGDTHQMKVNRHLEQGFVPKDAQGNDVPIFDLTQMKYAVVITTGPSYSTKRQESSQTMIEISQAYPQLWDKAGDLIVNAQDWPMADKLSERLKKFLPPNIAEADNPQEQIPPQVKQLLDQSHQMIDALTKQLNAANEQLQSKNTELASKEKIAAMNNETAVVIATIKGEMANNFGLLKEELAHLRHAQELAMAQKVAQNQPPQGAMTPPQAGT